MPFYMKKCEECGRQLEPCPSKFRADGERTFVGFYACSCNEARKENAERVVDKIAHKCALCNRWRAEEDMVQDEHNPELWACKKDCDDDDYIDPDEVTVE